MSESPSKLQPSTVKEGQYIKFIPRDASTEARPVPYYDFYAALKGTVAKIYDDGTAAVIIDRASLPDDARSRHEKSETDMRDKWMRSLSEDDRGKLTEAQKKFSLRYTLLVSVTDLIDISATPPPSIVKEKSARTEAQLDEIKQRAQQG